MKQVTDILMENRDETYAVFQAKLVPTVDPDTIIGVRTPDLKKIAKEIKDEPFTKEFLKELPHKYYDENQLHSQLISQMKDVTQCVKEIEHFLPYINNWATCDQIAPKLFSKHQDELLPYIRKWLGSDKVYTVRLGINLLIYNYLGDKFKPEYTEMVMSKDCDEYYINMAVAWYLSFALVKQWDSTIGFIESKKLSKFTQNKSIQKAIESYRISDDRKAYLRTLKV